MESAQTIPTSSPYDGEISDSEMRHWLFRFKYSVLHRRRGFSQGSHRSPFRRSSRIVSCFHLKVLIGLAASVYILARDKDATYALQLNRNGFRFQCQLSTHNLKAVLQQRGVSTLMFFERKDLEILAARTGVVTDVELALSVAANANLETFNSTCDVEAAFYRSLTFPEFRHRPLCTGNHIKPKTVAFDGLGLFIDRIEDNSESVWILSAVDDDTTGSQMLSPVVWALLVHHFSPLSVNFGVLLCNKLESICSEYGFTHSILVISLPVSLSNGKQSVEFRRLSLTRAPLCNDATSRGRRECLLLLDHVTTLIQNLLSHRVTSLFSPAQLHQNQMNKKYRHPQPLHVIWVPGERFCNKSYPLSNTDHSFFTPPPLAFSIHSIAYLNRASFWYLNTPTNAISTSDSSSEVSSDISLLDKVFLRLGCSTNQRNGYSRYILLTPEGYCSVQYGLSFGRLDNLLRWNYPSANDLFIFGLITLNTVLVVAAVLQSLIPFARSLNMRKFFTNSYSFLTQRKSDRPCEDDRAPTTSVLKLRAELITKVVKATFSGWKNYTPILGENLNSAAPSNRTRPQQLIALVERDLTLLFGIVLKLFFANLFFLLAALPIANFLGHTPPLADFLLHLLRFIVYWLDFANRPPIVFTAFLIFKTTFSALILVLLFDASVRWLGAKVSMRWLHSPPQAPSHVDPFIARLSYATVALASPALLARYLVLSDDEFSIDSPLHSCSSMSEGEQLPIGSESFSLRALETARLYRKAMELDRAIVMASKQSYVAWPVNQNLILQHSEPSNPNFTAKLFIWKLTKCPAAPKISNCSAQMKSKSTSPRFAFESMNEDRDKLYEAGSESDRSPQSSAILSEGRRHRRSHRTRKPRAKPHLEWPPWVIPCEKCVVCWREFECGILMAALSCGHAFHPECLKLWLDIGRDVCPMCRWPAHLSHSQREKHLISQLIKILRECPYAIRNNNDTSPTSPEIYSYSR